MSQQHQNVVPVNFRTETHGNQTLHVRDNSDSAMDDLFKVVQNPDPHKQSAWINRNMPLSFFHPPPMNQNVNPPVAVGHQRSRSAPVQLPQSISLPPPQHAKQQSMDLIDDMHTLQLNQSGWSTPNSHSQADLRYNNFASPNGQQPGSHPPQQWVNSPNKSHSASPLNQGSPQQQNGQQGTLSPNHSLSPASSLQSVIGPLPNGWEMSVTPDGEIYYINHIDRSTSWFHPLMGNKGQQPGPMKLSQLHPQTQIAITQHIQQQQAALAQQQQQTVSQQQQTAANQQQVSPNPGTLVGPRGVQPTVVQVPPQLASPPAGQASAAEVSQAYIQSELRKLQKQKETLRRQQEEILKKESQLAMMTGKDQMAGPASQPATNPAIQSVSTSGVDPFLGQALNAADSHARQNSADSGLGMASYSLPRTPEDFLSNVDEMDSTDTAGQKMLKPQSSDFNMNEMEGIGMDMGSITGGAMDAHNTPMDEHDLIPSLQDDIGTELLEGMEGQKIDNLLTWL